MHAQALTRLAAVLWLALLLSSAAAAQEPPPLSGATPLDRYVQKPDPQFGYLHYGTDDEYVYKTYFLTLTSQQWRDASEVDRPVWEHELSITVPAGLDGDDNPTAVLVVAGGSNGGPPLNDTQEEIGAAALLGQSVVAVVRQVPNEPLSFIAEQPPQPRSEDALLAYSMHRFLESCDAAAQTCDGEWPVQVAMTKATVRAMDAVQQFLEEKGVEIRDFVVTGASKRGWTTWLTAAVDPRVKGIAPISADLLNLPAQADRQWAAYGGRYSPALAPYAQFDIFCQAKREAAAGDALWRIVDPYSYRERLTMPKLIVNSAGDEFFLPDASRLYLHELPGENRLRYTFNIDHAQSGEEVDVLRRIVEWAKDVAEDKAVPGLDWEVAGDRLRVQPSEAPAGVWLWQATDAVDPDTRDFRLATAGPIWTQQPLADEDGDGVYEVALETPPSGWTAYSVEVAFPESGLISLNQMFTTDVIVRPDTLPVDPAAHCSGGTAPPAQ